MLRYHRGPRGDRRPAEGFKTRSPRFPMHHVSESTRGHCERRQVARAVEGLNAILRVVFVIGVTPPAHLNVELTEMLISTPIIESIETQDCSRFQVGNIADHKNVSSVSQTLGEFRLGTRPAPIAFLHTQ